VKDEPSRYVLDSYALLAHLEGEPGGKRVKAILDQAGHGQAQVYLSVINFGEAVYITERERGLTSAQRMIASVDQLPIAVIDADRALTLAAAHLKADHPIAYADAFSAALALDKDAVLVTGDPELHCLDPLLPIDWLPQT